MNVNLPNIVYKIKEPTATNDAHIPTDTDVDCFFWFI